MFSLRPSLVLLCLLPGLTPSQAQTPVAMVSTGPGDLLLAPTRVVFEGRKRSAEINLSNIGAVRATYRISLVRMAMDESGGIREVPAEPGPVALESLVRFSPREVTLEPQEAQTVRLQLRKPADLPVGEYRIHLLFRGVPPAAAVMPEGGDDAKGISIQLTPIYGLSIPLIVRHGETSAKVSLADIGIDPTAQALRFRLERSGNRSVYGDLKATFIPRSGNPIPICQAKGVAVYSPNPSRKMTLPISAQKPLTDGRLRVTYSLPENEGGALLAEGLLDLR